MRYGTRGTALDLSDVRADRAERDHAARQYARCMDLRRRAWAQGYQSALEQVGADVTITDGVPELIE